MRSGRSDGGRRAGRGRGRGWRDHGRRRGRQGGGRGSTGACGSSSLVPFLGFHRTCSQPTDDEEQEQPAPERREPKWRLGLVSRELIRRLDDVSIVGLVLGHIGLVGIGSVGHGAKGMPHPRCICQANWPHTLANDPRYLTMVSERVTKS
jgi:hypothetical protein